jgi:hypothetical protein
MSRYPLLALGFVFLVGVTALAQTKDSNKTLATSNAKSTKDFEAERLLRERRANAQSLLFNLAVDARNFKDATLRARTLARIADALWENDHERSLALFRGAFDAAEIADKEADERFQADIRASRAASGSGAFAVASQPETRREVLRLAAKHDHDLGEELVARFNEQKKADAGAKTARSSPFGNSDEATRQRMSVARELLASGDVQRALQFADPMLGIIDVATIDFLSYLREKDPNAADQRYASMLSIAASSPQIDANSASLLSSYIFTPHVFIAFVNGGTYTTASGNTPPADVSPELRLAFFRTAAAILLRPLTQPGQDQTSSGTDGQYLVIKRLLPLYEQYAPSELTASLRAQMTAFSSAASENTRQRDEDEWVRKGIGPDKPVEDREKSLLDQIDHAKTAEERDQLNFQLASLLAEKNDLRARDYVNKIDEMDFRKSARAYIDSSLAMRAIERKDPERALQVAKNGELSHFHRAWLLSQTARLLAKTDREQALSVLEDSATEAGRIETSDPDRPRAFFAIANVVFGLKRSAVWDTMSDAIKAANSADKFSGEDGQITFGLNRKGSSSIHQHSFPEFDVAGIFGKLADEDYDKAVQLAAGFEKEAPRASATIAIAKAVLEEKKP